MDIVQARDVPVNNQREYTMNINKELYCSELLISLHLRLQVITLISNIALTSYNNGCKILKQSTILCISMYYTG